jgi:hypothetical protein
MNIQVEHIDTHGTTHNRAFNLTRLAFAKHMAIAGNGYFLRPRNLMRTLGMFLHYSSYLQRQEFYNNHFSQPPPKLSDPTEKSQFSNIAGRAIADFLSKRIDGSFLTLNYEAVVPRPIHGQRPDLIAFNQNAIFTLEAKGTGRGNPGNMAMAAHKRQASSGNYQRNFSIACVSYDIYSQIQCKYHDPFNDNVEYDGEGLRKSSGRFYGGLLEFLNESYFQISEVTYRDEEFYEVELSLQRFRKVLNHESLFYPFWYHEFLELFRPRLILPKDIAKYAKNGLTRESKPFEPIQEGRNLYIDADRIGLRISST